MTQETISDRRKSPAVWLSVALDDTRISSDSFRVYFHIVRRVGRHEKAWPSYRSIGTHCFPELKEDSARVKAIKAVKELIAWNMIEVKKNQTAAGFHSNNYYLTDDSEWRKTLDSNLESPSSPTLLPSSPTLPPPSSPTLLPSSPTLPISDLQYKDFKILKDSQGKIPPTPQGGAGFLSQEGENLTGEEDRNRKIVEPPQEEKQGLPEQTKSSSKDQKLRGAALFYRVSKEDQDRIKQVYNSGKPKLWQPINNFHRAIKVKVEGLISSEDFSCDLEAFLTCLQNALSELNDPTTKFNWFVHQGNLGIETLCANYGEHLFKFSNAWTERQKPQIQANTLPDWALEAQREIEARQLKKAG